MRPKGCPVLLFSFFPCKLKERPSSLATYQGRQKPPADPDLLMRLLPFPDLAGFKVSEARHATAAFGGLVLGPLTKSLDHLQYLMQCKCSVSCV